MSLEQMLEIELVLSSSRQANKLTASDLSRESSLYVVARPSPVLGLVVAKLISRFLI